MPSPPQHTCPQGPVCQLQAMACDESHLWTFRADHPYTLDLGDRPCCHLPAMAHPPGECQHQSCKAITHDHCLACYAESFTP